MDIVTLTASIQRQPEAHTPVKLFRPTLAVANDRRQSFETTKASDGHKDDAVDHAPKHYFRSNEVNAV